MEDRDIEGLSDFLEEESESLFNKAPLEKPEIEEEQEPLKDSINKPSIKKKKKFLKEPKQRRTGKKEN
jgi:hypothetical protein